MWSALPYAASAEASIAFVLYYRWAEGWAVAGPGTGVGGKPEVRLPEVLLCGAVAMGRA